MPKHPDPKQWQDDHREFNHVEPLCKICSHPKRGLIEDLLLAVPANAVVAWANYHSLFAPKKLNETNTSKHRRNHMIGDELELAGDVSIDDKVAMKELLAMVDEDKLDLVAARGLIRVLKGSRKPSVRESLMALKIKQALPREQAEAERARLFVERLKRKKAEQEAATIEGEILKEETEGDQV